MAGSVLEDRTGAHRQVAVIAFKAHDEPHACWKLPGFLVLRYCVVGHPEKARPDSHEMFIPTWPGNAQIAKLPGGQI